MSDVKSLILAPRKMIAASLEHQSANQSEMMPANGESYDMMILGNNPSRGRGRHELPFEQYKNNTVATVKQLEVKIQKAKGNVIEIKRLKNMISAYESRLYKRSIVENMSR